MTISSGNRSFLIGLKRSRVIWKLSHKNSRKQCQNVKDLPTYPLHPKREVLGKRETQSQGPDDEARSDFKVFSANKCTMLCWALMSAFTSKWASE